MGIMPYHLEKGHYLLLLEDTLNEGIEAVVDDDAAVTFPGLAPPLLDAGVHARSRGSTVRSGQRRGAEAGGLLMWPRVHDRCRRRVPDLSDHRRGVVRLPDSPRRQLRHAAPNPNKPTGMWDGYQGNVERIIANVPRPCARGLARARSRRSRCRPAAPPRSWPIYFFFKCQQPFFEGWVTWQCHSVNRRAAGQVTVIFATPGHNHPVSDHPVPIDTNHDHIDDFVSDACATTASSSRNPVAAPAARPSRQAAPRRVGRHAHAITRSSTSSTHRCHRAIWNGARHCCRSSPQRTSATSSPCSRQHAAAASTQSSRGTWRHERQEQNLRPAVAHRLVELDVAGVLGKFLDGQFIVDETIGQATWRSEGSEFFAVRWRFEGKHARQHPRLRAHTFHRADRTRISVSGLTLVENTEPGQAVDDDLDKLLRSGTVVFHRYIDWLAVFAQTRRAAPRPTDVDRRHPLRAAGPRHQSQARLQRRTRRRSRPATPDAV